MMMTYVKLSILMMAVFVGLLSVHPAVCDEPQGYLKEEVLRSGTEEIVFACRQINPSDGHWYANFGYYSYDVDKKAYRARGRLCKLDLRTGEVTVLLDAPDGTVRDPQVHYDGGKVLFSYRKPGSEYFNLYEIDADGADLRQLTDGPYDDLEPTYVPDGGIVFCSTRCNRWVPCWMLQVAMMYRCDGDGGNIRQISSNIEQENTPWPLPDGRVIYQRWEYVDRSRVGFHHLWTMNPDGTGQMVYYGNMYPHTLMIDAKPIPGSDNKVVAVFAPGHGKKEHEGVITIVTPKTGPDDLASARSVSDEKTFYRDPYPLSEDCFLVARGSRILAMDGDGNTEELYSLPKELEEDGVQCHEPRPLLARRRERVIPERVDLASDTGRLFLADVYNGRHMQGVERGDIKKLLVLETLPKPVNFSGQQPPLSFGGTFQLERILGTVDVEPDGSAYFEAPANRSLLFVAMDERDMSVKRMQSFTTLMPGETTSCVGCHEHRTKAPLNGYDGTAQAGQRPPQQIKPVEGIPDVFDFPRDIQPILDRHCLKCHDYDKRKGNVILSGDYGPIFSHSYYTLTWLREFADGRDMLGGNMPPRSLGAGASPLMRKLGMPGKKRHHRVHTTAHERDMVRYWIESGAPYAGTYAALGCGMIGNFPGPLDTTDRNWPSSVDAAKALKRRCIGCHDETLPLPLYLSDNHGLKPSHLDLDSPKARFSRHRLFNLTRPELSLVLLAPLDKKAGGYGICKPRPEAGIMKRRLSVFADTDDPDYQKLLALCRDGKEHLARIGRFDQEGFRASLPYVRELKRYGILAQDLPADADFDTYAADRAYWRSLWWQPRTR
jgi:hypothetical protein